MYTDAPQQMTVTTGQTEAEQEAVRWVATLSNGSTAVEHSGQWKIIPGERKPWVRLCTFLDENGLHLTSLRLNYAGRTIHLPRERFDRFGLGENIREPNFYSVQYHLEADDILSGSGDFDLFIALSAHFDNYVVHFIQDITEGNNSWVVVTDPLETLAATPSKVT